jgi:carbonic anhydrase/acetyltransferase-like protein (isoleucine patch superfamily)
MLYQLGDRKPELAGGNFVADDARVIGSVQLMQDASVWFGCVLRGDMDDIIIGERSNIQDGAVLHTDPGVKLRVGNDVTVGHQVMLHGCTIGDGCLIGIKAVILNRAVIGRNCIIGAGALIPEGKIIPDNSLVMGMPGKVVRQTDANTAKMLKMQAAHYVQNGHRFLRELSPL